MSYNKIKNQEGITLIETVAALVIISILLISFIGVLYQTKKTTVSAEQTITSTYVGQETMEHIYSLSKTIPFAQLHTYFQNSKSNVNYITSNSSQLLVTYNHEHANYSIELSITLIQNPSIQVSTSLNLYNVVVKVYENGSLKNVVESIYQFH